jgi:Ribbon-helix-helix domain
MKRMQVYVHENIWEALHARSRQQGISISKLVRQAVIDKYGDSTASREESMPTFVGIWRDRRDLPDVATYLRKLRKGKRLQRISSRPRP